MSYVIPIDVWDADEEFKYKPLEYKLMRVGNNNKLIYLRIRSTQA